MDIKECKDTVMAKGSKNSKGTAVKLTADNEDIISAAHDFLDLPEAARHVWFAFIKSYKVVVDTIDRELRERGLLSLAEYEIVGLVESGGGRIRFIDLAKLTLLSQSRISRQIDALQAKDLLLREITDSNRRATFALITPKGREVLKATADAVVRALQVHFYSRIPTARQAVLRDILEGLLEPGYQSHTQQIINAARTMNGKPPIVAPDS